MEEKVETYLETDNRWKDFINESGTDLENASLESISAVCGKRRDNIIETDITVNYNLLENSGYCETAAEVTVDGNEEIESIERID